MQTRVSISYFGKTNFRKSNTPFGLLQADRLYHFYILGKTVNPTKGYSQRKLNTWVNGGLHKATLFTGTKTMCFIIEKILIYSYHIHFWEKPPGNKVYH